ncbi:hypothetical protein BLNAU_22222 [Blattamonas nauphoetae]|uniref:Uncharacterized protein n=1 Tax=Blattamonas nauphoetae TaxID=2049346 RepID=A0ABQ9WTM6_9EUKA|nr:hypothetical protein BLNAU_22222 [Blattamonas nauphoetae]
MFETKAFGNHRNNLTRDLEPTLHGPYLNEVGAKVCEERLARELLSSSLGNEALTDYFPKLKGGAGWDLYPFNRYAIQNMKVTNQGSACLRGREGQRVVLEADGREGKRKLKLSQDGETQPTFFTNIPVPFRFAVQTYKTRYQYYIESVEIESIEVVSSPQMVGGTIAVPMDE